MVLSRSPGIRVKAFSGIPGFPESNPVPGAFRIIKRVALCPLLCHTERHDQASDKLAPGRADRPRNGVCGTGPARAADRRSLRDRLAVRNKPRTTDA